LGEKRLSLQQEQYSVIFRLRDHYHQPEGFGYSQAQKVEIRIFQEELEFCPPQQNKLQI
jgi:hypothetical protein